MRIVAASLALVSCYLLAASVVQADQLKMKCRIADFRGTNISQEYAFLFDTASGSLSVTADPKESVSEKWTLLLAQGGHAVFYYIAEDTVGQQVAGRVRILSLNFEKPDMIKYWMCGEMGEPITLTPKKADCHRLN